MPWKDPLGQLKNEFKQIKSEFQGQRSSSSQPHPQEYQRYHQQPYHQQPYQQPPQQYHHPQPAPTYHPPHPPPPVNGIYWRPRFDSRSAVTQEWDAKMGNGPDGWGNQELQHYTALPDNVFYTNNNLLVLRALAQSTKPNPEQRYTSARLVSRQPLSRDHGALTAIIQLPCASGIWPAFWLLPQEPFTWPTDGEVDIAESWNGDCEDHSCLHWGHHHEGDKHRVLGTKIPDMRNRPVRFDLVWDQPGGIPGQGRLMWYIDGRPVMKEQIPPGTRPMRDMTVLLNVAMGGNVCGGQVPADGYYDMCVYSLYASQEPEFGGWHGFEQAWHHPATPHGHGY